MSGAPFLFSGANPSLWLEDDSKYMTFSSGSLVERWSDVRGNGTYVENTTVSEQPTHVGDGLGVNFMNKELISNISNGRTRGTLFVVAQSNGTNGFQVFGATESSTSHISVNDSASRWQLQWSDGVLSTQTLQCTQDLDILTEFKLGMVQLDTGGAYWRNSGGLYASGGSKFGRAREEVDFTPKVGDVSGLGSNMKIQALIYFPTPLSWDDREAVEDYLADKYSLTLATRVTTTQDMVLVLGDSTARGNGDVTNLTAKYQGSQTGIRILDTGAAPVDVNQYITTGGSKNNVQPDVGVVAYASLTDSLAYEYRDRTGEDVDYLKYGVGFATLGTNTAGTNNWYYNNMSGQFDLAMRRYNLACWFRLEREESIRPNIVGVVICLGDNDANDTTDAANFEDNLNEFLDRLKPMLLNQPTAKIQLRRPVDTGWGGADRVVVRTNLANVIASRDDVEMVDTDIYGTLDGTHTDEAGDQAMGLLIANRL